MPMESNKLYIDYLDYTVSKNVDIRGSIDRLRFDLLLFPDEILCISVPACVKLSSTTDLLMKLSPFWESGRIRLILSRKHKENPWNYFNSRKKLLEKNIPEEKLISHFEYTAYISHHTFFFYNVFIKEIIHAPKELYLRKSFNTDEVFRRFVMTQINHTGKHFFSTLPVTEAIHMGNILNELYILAEDRHLLFQRSVIVNALLEKCDASPAEINYISRILDRGFAYANGLSCYAAPISFISNRFTGQSFIKLLKSTDRELYKAIHDMNWKSLFKLSQNDVWLNFLDHLNQLLLLYHQWYGQKNKVFPSLLLKSSFLALDIFKKIYEIAIETIEEELFHAGASIIDLINFKESTANVVQQITLNQNDYINLLKETQDLFPALRIAVKSINRQYKSGTMIIKEEGFTVPLYYE